MPLPKIDTWLSLPIYLTSRRKRNVAKYECRTWRRRGLGVVGILAVVRTILVAVLPMDRWVGARDV